jgi:hypothetical protein
MKPKSNIKRLVVPGRERFGGETFELYEDEDESVGDADKNVA